jgi:hypothetical protein
MRIRQPPLISLARRSWQISCVHNRSVSSTWVIDLFSRTIDGVLEPAPFAMVVFLFPRSLSFRGPDREGADISLRPWSRKSMWHGEDLRSSSMALRAIATNRGFDGHDT